MRNNPTNKILAVCLLTMLMGATRSESISQSPEAQLACEAIIHTRGLQLALTGVFFGNKQSFPTISESSQELIGTLRSYAKIRSPPPESFIARIRQNSDLLLNHEDTLLTVYRATREIAQNTAELHDFAKTFSVKVVAAGSTPTQIAASDMLIMLIQRLGKSAAELFSYQGVDPESIFLLKRDPETFQTIAVGLREGNVQLRLTAIKTAGEKEQLRALMGKFEKSRVLVDIVTSNFTDVIAAKKAQNQLQGDLESLDRDLQSTCFGRRTKSKFGLQSD